tara:strand:- start:1334 stop:3145 length:1812 start_codon:yes stop_codon:yes gene_type:complete
MGRFSQTYRIALAGLFLFVLGFLLLHGRVAQQSGSWRYTVTHDDEYAFWVIADGAGESPRSDANPFYAEHAGETNPLLSYPTVILVGTIGGWLGVPVLTLLPLWKVGAPFLAWLVIWQCLVRIWGCREGPAAATSLCVLCGTMLLHGSAQHMLLRFSRPIDTLAASAVWLSCALNPRVLKGKTQGLTALAAAVVLLASPFHAVFCTITTWCAWLWSRWRRQDPDAGRVLWLASLASAVGLTLMLGLMHQAADNRWMQDALAFDAGVEGGSWLSVLLLVAAIFAVLIRHRGQSLTRSDMSLLCILAVEPLAANVQIILGQGYGVAIHRYYFLIFELLALIAWLADAVPKRQHGERWRPWEVPVVTVAVACVLWMVSFPETNFLRLLPRAGWPTAPYDNSRLLLQLWPVLFVLIWLVRRTPLQRSPAAVGPMLAAVFVCFCFATFPPQLPKANHSVPFHGAHTWLAEHAESAEVLLTVPPEYGLYDYAPLYCPVKLYYNPYASRWVRDEYEREYRKSIYFSLYCGVLDQPGVPIPESLEVRLSEFSLDYILAWKGPLNDRWRRQTAPQLPPLAGQLDASIERQLGPFLQVEYEDDRCVLWRVVTD